MTEITPAPLEPAQPVPGLPAAPSGPAVAAGISAMVDQGTVVLDAVKPAWHVRLREWAHGLLPVVGLLLALQAPIVAEATTLDIGSKWVSGAFGILGVVSTVLSKLIDSRSYTAITVANGGLS